ncbi:ABC transporter substrate-binding protein [Sporosarcina psychrophila]|uniref:ABC transporter substrate-binding protein n=1 Tax=Sporosarcina psychrophila TaxID=1476 RepID=UPI00078EF648|nr:ABC transporter substrate-binding protein [Sporosarcina psychrophila]AMQ07706.1 hypothetical protein AZE41_18155 [Sporosarcina psychrophila]
MLKKSFLFIILMVLTILGACGLEETGQTTETSKEKDTTLIVAQQSDTSTLDPQKQGKMPDMNILINMFDTLITTDSDQQLAPSLAESWEVVDEDTWEFKLREDVIFHNGEKFNAETVKFSIERLLDPATQSPIVELSNVESVEVIDEYIVQLHTAGSDPILPNKLTLFGGVIVPKEYIEENGEEHFAEQPIGTGPFKFVSWKRDNEVVMESFEDYWQGASAIKTLKFRAIPDEANLAAALRAGEIDIATGITPDIMKQLEGNTEINVKSEQGIRTFFISLDTKDPESPLHKKEVRQALNYAVDVDLMIDSVLDGQAKRVTTLIPEENFGYDESITPYEYNPEKARELLNEAGYPDGFDITFDANNLDSNNVQVITAQLKKIGVNVEANLMDGQTFISNIRAEKASPMYYQGNTGWTLDAMSNFQSYIKSDRRYNRWEDDKVDKLIDIEEQSLDSKVRQEAFTELQEIIKEEAPFIFLYQINNLYGIQEGVNWQPNSIGILRMYGASK